ncbi:tripartite ATP-independent transporter DctP family solute receptor [Rhodoferax ferrireducens]|uniref:Tripartite ATP-independent transporter DctP family solute receptor n=1 Tax=Rhodoferax ferrireducens TaxID=192843 RepID=A0ABU2CC72_9BURK|nr:TRAP transporter substrate-binding protein [Rhodoferax ferrireducens]MDR7378924.1 tripartite ATP-independent transporter DctP family solute receptor [Rhodoferax ferrireducens]
MKLKSLALAATLLAALTGPVAAQIKEHVFKVGIGLSDDHPQALAVKYFGEQLMAKSGGKMNAKLFASGSLGNDVSMTSALRGGTLEMTVPDSSTLVSLIKPFGVLNLPLTFNTEQEADAVLDGPFGQKLLAKLPEKGLIGLGYWENGFRHVTNSRRPITKADDIAGLKLRVIQNQLFLDTFSALGANATPMPFTELYSAMESSAVDGQENPPATILASKFFEVQKHLVLSRHMYSAWVLLMSKKTWDGLNAQEQKIVQDAAREATLYERKTIRAFSEKAVGELKKAGMQVTELPAAEQAKMRTKLQPVLAKFSKEFGEDTTAEMAGELAKLRK